MSPTLTCLAMALMGADLGFRPASNGGTDFIIHVNPATLQATRPGDPIELYVERAAQGLRPSHFYITPFDDKLPGEVSVPPARAPIGPASPVIPAVATSSAPSPYTTPGAAPVTIPPPSSVLPEQTGPRPGTLANSTSAESRFGGLAPVNPGGGNPVQPDRPWLLMCLLVIGLSASNSYIGWLFWDSRQRYRGLLARTFSVGQPAAEA